MSWTARGESEKSVNKFSQAEVQTYTLHTHTHTRKWKAAEEKWGKRDRIVVRC